ncbi:MAG: succinyldiaminopimelate transaminase [Gammaproteobacteria bacterium]|nr:succinyldiaminopimelate transaminase [Gammaproteobacteria bacterium]
MNPDLARLQPYPFERLARLKHGVSPAPGKSALSLAMGEPKHQPPGFIAEALIAHLHGLEQYPLTRGTPELRAAIARWLQRRYGLSDASLDPERHILPVNGTREALFSIAQTVIDRARRPLVMMPNPFYQIYDGAALLAGAEPWYINTTAETHWLPDFSSVPAEAWQRCQLLYLCSPGNPTGAVIGLDQMRLLLELAERYDFIIAADECYSELYDDETDPPPGLLQAAAALGTTDYKRCIIFQSLSKRSNVPGLRSGFVAGDAAIIEGFHRYRTYHGSAMPPPTQAASLKAWDDETHVIRNRALYRAKFDAVLEVLAPVLDVKRPPAGFYLWPRTPRDDAEFARGLFAAENVIVLPGSYLSRLAHGIDPGQGCVRMALVPPLEECVEAAWRIRGYIDGLRG